MQTSGKRSIISRPVSDRTTRVAGLGLSASFLFFAMTIVVSCSPGELPSEFQGMETGGSGGSGGTGGAGGAPATTTADTPVMNCPKFSTLGAADTWFQMRCGINSTCHGTGAVWTDMQTQTAPLWMKAVNKAPAIACFGGMAKLIDKTDWMRSYLIIKTSQAMPACPSGGMGPGTIMPPPAALQGAGVMAAPLTAEEQTCISQFAQAAAGR